MPIDMVIFRRLALHRFVKMHPPARQVSPAPAELVTAYEGILPASLLELWRRKGLGFYGDLQLALIDPRAWQPVLDRWIVSPPDAVRRIPIALTPFGVLLYYRKLTSTDEDVVYIDPVSKRTGDLAWSVDDFFNKIVCEQDQLEAIISPPLAQSARLECGVLAPGEVYEVDHMLLPMQMVRITKVNALDMHRRLHDAVDPHEPKADKPTTVADALPVEYRSMFENVETGPRLAGLYLSSYLDDHRLLALRPDGQYYLLFWQIHHKTFERIEVRAYSGSYEVSRNSDGDETVELEIELRSDSPGSDSNDVQLVAMYTNGATLLLRTNELEGMATAIGAWDQMGRSGDYFRRVTLDDAVLEEPSDGRMAPPFADLPLALQALVHIEPLLPMITHVAEPNPDEEDEGEGTVMCTLSLGEDDGLRMNMPLFSPKETGRQLEGWIWEMAPNACKAGITYRRGENGVIDHGPVVGDVLTTRAQE
ncbi:GAD-like domain-containing protein [Burkholderia ubonensis]|uniref:GAD-like domain-containing protein n=1 Tax=Burkholderia ubonensis TaxID=101571 RepID=UPI001E285AF8|nr:GAD-like domain-containing protein [Burkholderia ubonensis]